MSIEAEEYFKKEYGEGFFGGKFYNCKNADVLEFSIKDIHNLMQAYHKDQSRKELEALLRQMRESQREVISSPIRFNGVHISIIEKLFESRGINTDVGF